MSSEGHHYGIFSAQYAPHTGGVEIFTQNLAHALVAEGNRVTVVASRTDGSPAREVQSDGVEVVRLPCLSLMDGRLPISRRTGEYKRLMEQLGCCGVDRMLVNTRFYRHSLEGLRLARRMDVPAVVLDHGSAYLVLGNKVADAVLRGYERTVTRVGRRFAPRYAGVSRMSTEWLKTFGIETTRVVPNAIDAAGFRACSLGRDFRRELGIGDDQVLVVSVGRLAPEKGALQLAQAAELLGPDFVVVYAGEGSLRGRIEGMGLGNVRLAGGLDHGDLSALLSQADVFCLPTRSEGFCTSLLEAGAWGVTPVMPRVGGVDEVMGDPVRFGRLLHDTEPDTVAAVLQDMRDSKAYGRMSELAQKVEREHSWHESVRALEACFV